MLQFIGRQELTEKKRSEFEVDSWIRSNSIDERSVATEIETFLAFAVIFIGLGFPLILC